MERLKSPYPYFGGKRKVADMVWRRFGKVANYVEPFFGSGAVLLAREGEPTTETVNDADGFVSNFWRALQAEPDKVASYADWPVNENDFHARHSWLVRQKDSMQSQLEGDPEWFDAKVAGWWVWGTAAWIGSGWCSGNGPWKVVGGKLVNSNSDGQDVHRKLAHVGDAGRGVNRQLVHVGDAGQGINRKRERLGGFSETGVNAIGCERKRPTISGVAGGNAMLPANDDLRCYMQELSDRMRRVRVCCGDWSRVIGPSVTFKHGLTAVFLDPPYNEDAFRCSELYRVDSLSVSNHVREWAIANGNNPLMRMALCGYEGEHLMPPEWDCVAWNAGQGFAGQAKDGISENGKKERIWFSPHCEANLQGKLF